MMKDFLVEIADESACMELLIARIYRTFSRRFPEDGDFWHRLSVEESNHAALLRSGREYFLKIGRFPAALVHQNLGELKSANAMLEKLLENIDSEITEPEQALAKALELEKLPGEIRFQQFMDSVSADDPIVGIFQQLNREEKDHSLRIHQYMMRRSSPK